MTDPTTIVVMINPLPKILPTEMRIPDSSVEAMSAVNTSGAPLAKAMRVIPDRVWDIFNYSAR